MSKHKPRAQDVPASLVPLLQGALQASDYQAAISIILDYPEHDQYPELQHQLAKAYRHLLMPQQALAHIAKALVLLPKHIPYLQTQATIAYEQENFSLACSALAKAHQLNPKDEVTLAHWIQALCHNRQIDKATKAIQRLNKIEATHPEAIISFVTYQRLTGNLPQALQVIQALVKHHPQLPSALFELAQCHVANQARDKAEQVFTQIVANYPNHVFAQRELATLYFLQNRFDLAATHFAIEANLRPQKFAACFYCGISLVQINKPLDALVYFMRALGIDQHSRNAKQYFCKLVRQIELPAYSEVIYQTLCLLFAGGEIDHKELATVVSRILLLKYEVTQLDTQACQQIANDVLCRQLLLSCQICTQDMETVIRTVRTSLLDAYEKTNCFDLDQQALACAISVQGFITEYVFDIECAEQERLGRIRDAWFELGLNKKLADSSRMLLLAMYYPIDEIFNEGERMRITRKNTDQIIHPLIDIAILNPQKEIALKPSITRLHDIDDEVSQQVQTQYEANPYPRWLTVAVPDAEIQEQAIGALTQHLLTAADSRLCPALSGQQFSILVAGCGTGKQPIMIAQVVPHANITAIDLSLSSLAYAKRQADVYGITNIDFIHGDLLHLAQLEQQYDFIFCCGVLHHMADPTAGLKQLVAQLTPGGLIKISLYSKPARALIFKAREFIQAKGFADSPKEICEIRNAIAHGEYPELMPLSQWWDFYSTSECRDLLFHVQDQCFTIPQLQTLLADSGLSFLGFYLPFDDIKTAYASQFPDDPEMTNWTNWAQFEIQHPETFASMYQMLCVKAKE